MPWRQRLLLYLYGTPHIVGSSLAIVGLALYFLGFIKSFWFPIVAGLYVAGVLLTPQSLERHIRLSREATVDEIRRALEHLLKTLKGDVASTVYQHVGSIVSSIRMVLPRLKEAQVADHISYTIREMALTYLPETLENYLRLPRGYIRCATARPPDKSW